MAAASIGGSNSIDGEQVIGKQVSLARLFDYGGDEGLGDVAIK